MSALQASATIEAQVDYLDAVAAYALDLADAALADDDLETCLRYAHLSAAMSARQNRWLFSPRIEKTTRRVAHRLVAGEIVAPVDARLPNKRLRALHVLSEALPAGGVTAMAVRWIAAEAERTEGHVALLSVQSSVPPPLVDAVRRSGGSVHAPPEPGSWIATAAWLRNLAADISDHVVLHIDVADVVCAAAFNISGGPPVILVNHTAHLFWTGISYADTVANCRASVLEAAWAEEFRACDRHCAIPIPLFAGSDSSASTEVHRPGRPPLLQDVRAELGIPPSAVVLVTVGARFKYSRFGEIDFLATMETVLEQCEDAYLLVIGFEPDRRWKDAGIRTGGRLRVMGTLDRRRIDSIYQCSDIYVEGFPFGTTTALLEAAASGTAVVLAPALCPPPYSTDGIAIDQVLERVSSIDDYIGHLTRLILDANYRAAIRSDVRRSVLRHHAGEGWTSHLQEALASLPVRHRVYDIKKPQATPRAIHEYWARLSPAWTWTLDEAFEHLLLRALAVGVMPTISKETRLQLRTAHGRAVRDIPRYWLLSVVFNRVLPLLPPNWRASAARGVAFVTRPNFCMRTSRSLIRIYSATARSGAYDEYRRLSTSSTVSGDSAPAPPLGPTAIPAVRSIPQVSVIIPTFNRAASVRHAIDSVLGQSFDSVEVIVIDDGSVDETWKVLATYGSEIVAIRQSNKGVSAARNAGAAAARGRWLAFLDSDDVWDASCLDQHMRHLDGGSNVVFQCADSTIRDGGVPALSYFALNGTSRLLGARSSVVLAKPFRFVIRHGPWQVGAVVVRRQVFDEVGGFDESLTISEDIDLLARLAAHGPARFIRSPLMTVNRSIQETASLSTMADRCPLQKRDAHERMYRKLEALPGLSFRELQAVRAARSFNQRAIGKLLLTTGQRTAAAEAFRLAFALQPSFTAIGGMALSAAPEPIRNVLLGGR